MKTIIYKNHTDGNYYMTDSANYSAYIQNARKINKLDGVRTLEDVASFIEKACKWWNCSPSDFEVVNR